MIEMAVDLPKRCLREIDVQRPLHIDMIVFSNQAKLSSVLLVDYFVCVKIQVEAGLRKNIKS